MGPQPRPWQRVGLAVRCQVERDVRLNHTREASSQFINHDDPRPPAPLSRFERTSLPQPVSLRVLQVNRGLVSFGGISVTDRSNIHFSPAHNHNEEGEAAGLGFGLTTELTCDARSVTSVPVRRTRYEGCGRFLCNASVWPCIVKLSEMLCRRAIA